LRSTSLLFALLVLSAPALAQDAAALRQRHAQVQARLAENPFGRALHVDSDTSSSRHKGEIHAVVDQPYQAVASGLKKPAHWCEILTLQVNIKRCDAAGNAIAAFITRKPRQTVEDAHRIDFQFQNGAERADYLQVALRAETGPVGTRDYEIVVQVAPLDEKRTLMHMSYAYKLGAMARLAMDAYLAGPGREKYGFSVVGKQPDGRAQYVDGTRGIVERNAMRYYLAVDAYLGAPQLEPRLRRWYSETARYPQLREEVTLDQYVQMKLAGVERR
jgi:hypothetical protein